jgi:lipoprotein-anchoring transpeptidase ErfK/SrfK
MSKSNRFQSVCWLSLFVILTAMVEGRASARTNALFPNEKGESTLPKTNAQKRKPRPAVKSVSGAEMKQADARLAEMGYGKGRTALISFQKYEGRDVTGRLGREDFDAIMSASAPQAKDSRYKHVEIDLDRQVLLLTDDDGVVKKVLPVSTGSNKNYNEKGMSGLAYTPRGRFRIYAKISGWRKSPLGMLYYPSYFSDGLAIRGNSSVPDSPQSHGCIRIPNSAAIEMSRQLPVGTIVLIYDSQRSFQRNRGRKLISRRQYKPLEFVFTA